MLEEKVSGFILQLSKQAILSPILMAQLLELDYFHQMLQKHIDLIERRIGGFNVLTQQVKNKDYPLLLKISS